MFRGGDRVLKQSIKVEGSLPWGLSAPTTLSAN